jgi:PLP dependent protein
MAVNIQAYQTILQQLAAKKATLVAVSKTKPIQDILALYQLGQRDFGENYVQELVDKQAALPKDIRWHFIGHLQSNKVKYIAPFVHLIHSADSPNLLKEINKQAVKNNRNIQCLLQVHIAREETKFGFNEAELMQLQLAAYQNITIAGLMGMASFSDDAHLLRTEFKCLKSLYQQCLTTFSPSPASFSILSMGMSSDYTIALEEGSNMVRIGSILFGVRNKPTA